LTDSTDLREDRSGVEGAAEDLLGDGEAPGFLGASETGAEAEPLTSGAGAGVVAADVLGCADDRPLFPPGGTLSDAVGEAKVRSPGYVEPREGTGTFATGTESSGCRSVMTIAVTQAAMTDRARVPAIQSRRVPGTREVSGAQPFSHG
jgi:hypothetical protein